MTWAERWALIERFLPQLWDGTLVTMQLVVFFGQFFDAGGFFLMSAAQIHLVQRYLIQCPVYFLQRQVHKFA